MPALIALLLLVVLAAAPAASARTVEIGTAINNGGFASGGQAYRDALLRHDAFTAESAMKMIELQPARGSYSFARADSMVAWARANGRKIHGHTLVWCSDKWTPQWVLQGSWTRASLLAVMQDHIRRVMGRWKGQIASWDVVNEAIAADGSRRDCVWSRVIGPDWVEQAFRTARAADPAAKLYLNEFGADTPNAAFLATEALARDFKARGVPLDGIGLQHHAYGLGSFQHLTEEVLRRIGALGLTAHISELDSTTSPIDGTVAEKLAKQGQVFQSIASACQAVPACTRVTTWGVADQWSYKGPGEMALALDAAYAEKPAWTGLAQELRPAAFPVGQAPSAPGSIRTGVKHDRGTFLVTWGPSLDFENDPVTYRLEHRDFDDAGWSPVATGIRSPEYRFAASVNVEHQGTWRYRLRAADPTASSGWTTYTSGGGVVVVDRIPPAAPLLVTDRAPVWDGWYRDGVEVRFAEGGDAALPDGSPGSGLNPASVPAPRLISTTGTTVVSGSGKDRSGNPSPAVSGSYKVDATAPVATAATGSYQPGTWTRGDVTVTFACSDAGAGLAGAVPAAVVVSGEGAGQLRSADCADRVGHVTTATSGAISIDKSPPTGSMSCPAPVTAGAPASATWAASDALSGLTGGADGTIALDTARAGTFTASRAVSDRVGHATTLSCTYRVDPPAQPTATPTATPTSSPPPSTTPSTPPASTAPRTQPSPPAPARTRSAPGPSTPTRTYPPAATPVVAVNAPRRLVGKRRIRLVLSCSAADCDGLLRLSGSRSRRFALLAGERRRIAVRLLRRERRALARRGRLVVRVRVELAGAPAADARRLTVRAPRRTPGA